MLTDPVSDFLTRIRNGLAADHTEVEVPASRLKKEISRILTEQGYITSFEVEPTAIGEVIKIQLKYTEDRRPVISGMRRVSRPGRRPRPRPRLPLPRRGARASRRPRGSPP